MTCTTAVHICYGYGIQANIDWKKSLGEEWRQYEQILPALARSSIQQVSLECVHSHVPPQLMALLQGKDVMVGVIDVASDQVETPEEVADTIGLALQYVPRERLIACTNCGLAPMNRELALQEAARRWLRVPHWRGSASQPELGPAKDADRPADRAAGVGRGRNSTRRCAGAAPGFDALAGSGDHALAKQGGALQFTYRRRVPAHRGQGRCAKAPSAAGATVQAGAQLRGNLAHRGIAGAFRGQQARARIDRIGLQLLDMHMQAFAGQHPFQLDDVDQAQGALFSQGTGVHGVGFLSRSTLTRLTRATRSAADGD